MSAIKAMINTVPTAAMGRGLGDKLAIFLLIAFETTSFDNPARRARVKALLCLLADSAGVLQVRFTRDGHDLGVSFRVEEDGDLSVASEFIRAGYQFPPREPRQIIDGGANIGLFSVMASKRFPQVQIASYEANPANIAILKQNISANKANAQVLNKALWSGPGELVFQSHMAYSGRVVADHDVAAKAVRVPAELPEVGEDCWLKLDIEGAEYEVMPALLAAGAYPRWISAELHFYDTKGIALVAQLQEHGYKLTGLPDDDSAFLAEVFAGRA